MYFMSCIIKKTKNIFVATFIALAPCSVFAISQTDITLHAQAEEMYQKNDFARASQLYQRIEHKTPSVYFNLGNCAYKTDKLGYALLYWRRAERDWGLFGRRELLQSIDLIKLKTATPNLKVTGVNQPYSKVVINALIVAENHVISMIKAIPLLHLQILVLILWAILFLYVRCFRKKRLAFLIYSLFALLAISASMLAFKYSLQLQNQLVVIHANTPLLSGAGSNFAPMGHLPEGQEADIIKESGQFYRIRVNKNIIGWIDKQFVEKI